MITNEQIELIFKTKLEHAVRNNLSVNALHNYPKASVVYNMEKELISVITDNDLPTPREVTLVSDMFFINQGRGMLIGKENDPSWTNARLYEEFRKSLKQHVNKKIWEFREEL